MLSIKNKRYKPLYKKFKNLKKNVQNRRKLLTFNKLKWQNLILSLHKTSNYRSKNFKSFDHNKYCTPRFVNKSKKNFQYKLHTRQRLKLFYGSLLTKYIKKTVKICTLKKNINSNFFFIEKLENRLDTILYRAHFASSIKNARQFITHGIVFVNNIKIKSNSFNLKKGDFIKINTKYLFLIRSNVANSNMWPLPPKYLHINYKIFQIVLINDIKFTGVSTYFPFWLDLNSIIPYYQY